MEFTVILLGLLLAVVAASVLIGINMFAIKEKSYEEAINEQRKQNNALLGKKVVDKSKDKKAKKAVKKANKQQVATLPTSSTEAAEESEDNVDSQPPSSHESSNAPQASKPHVEFEEPNKETAVPSSTAVESSIINKKKRKKKEKIRPILVHKTVDIPVALDLTEVPLANHFEELHPKDDFELLQSHIPIKEKIVEKETESKPEKAPKKQELAKEKPPKSKQSSETKETKPAVKDKNLKNGNDKPVVTPQQSEVLQKSKSSKPVAVPPTTSTAIQEEPVVEVATVVPQANGIAHPNKEKKKKKGEVNPLEHLIGSKEGEVNLSLLFKAVRNAELSRSELQILIDILLNKQHEAPEVLDEWSEGKADPIQKLKKQLAEKEKALQEEQEACASAQAKLREVRMEQRNEVAILLEKNKKLESMYQSNRTELLSMTNSWHNLNAKMQAMHAQINQDQLNSMSLREELADLQRQRQLQIDLNRENVQETEVAIQELQSVKNQLSMELAAKQNQVAQLQHQVKSEIDEKENCLRQFDDLRRDFEHRLNIAHRQEGELKVELSKLNSLCQQKSEEIRRLELSKNQAYEELKNIQNQKEELHHSLTELKKELLEMKAAKLELEQSQVNGLAKEGEQHKEEILNLENKLSSITHELEEVKKNYKNELEISKNSISRLEQELSEQKDKNDELRKKNWKVMDALKAAESKNSSESKTSANNVPVNLDESMLQVRLEEQERHKQFILKLFPNIEVPVDSSSEDWANVVDTAIKNYIADIGKQEKRHLQEQVNNYKGVIDQTEKLLQNLQETATEQERHWHRDLTTKNEEIEALKERHTVELNKLKAHYENKNQPGNDEHITEAPISKTLSDVENNACDKELNGTSENGSPAAISCS